MSSNVAVKISVAQVNDVGAVCIVGRATVACSVRFRELMEHLRDDGASKIYLFLESCLLMDSTFLGVLAKQGALSEGKQLDDKNAGVVLVSPSTRVIDLIDNLGVIDSFLIETTNPDVAFVFQEVQLTGDQDLKEITKTSLEAHRALIEMNEENRSRFAGVTSLLEKELKDSDEK